MLNIGFVEIIRERYGDGWGAVKTGGGGAKNDDCESLRSHHFHSIFLKIFLQSLNAV